VIVDIGGIDSWPSDIDTEEYGVCSIWDADMGSVLSVV
jgi:hypothetical protein